MWFKKKSQISGFNANTAVDGDDWRTTSKAYYGTSSNTLPSAADAGNYFYLPALGRYSYPGQLGGVGNYGYYWSSSASPWYGSAYGLYFDSGNVNVYYYGSNYGYSVGTFE